MSFHQSSIKDLLRLKRSIEDAVDHIGSKELALARDLIDLIDVFLSPQNVSAISPFLPHYLQSLQCQASGNAVRDRNIFYAELKAMRDTLTLLCRQVRQRRRLSVAKVGQKNLLAIAAKPGQATPTLPGRVDKVRS